MFPKSQATEFFQFFCSSLPCSGVSVSAGAVLPIDGHRQPLHPPFHRFLYGHIHPLFFFFPPDFLLLEDLDAEDFLEAPPAFLAEEDFPFPPFLAFSAEGLPPPDGGPPPDEG